MSKKTSIEDLMTNASFVRWIRDESTPTESNYWNTWLQEDAHHQELLKKAEFLLELDKYTLEKQNIEHEFTKLKEAISRDEQRHRSIRVRSSKIYSRKRSWAVAAGILMIIALMSGLLLTNYNEEVNSQANLVKVAPVQEFQTDFGEKKTLRLQDGSKIILNANSQLRYDPNIKKGQNVQVWLEGEAYFDIVHYENERSRYFTVHTRDGMVQVLGTKFVVNSFGKQTHAVLNEGKVKVIVKNDSPDHVAERILKPGDMARFARAVGNKKIDIQKVNPVVYTSWIEDKMVFENTPMNEVKNRIENTFGLKVVIVNEDLLGRNLSGSIKSSDIEFLKEALSKILNARIEQRDQVLYIGSKRAGPLGR